MTETNVLVDSLNDLFSKGDFQEALPVIAELTEALPESAEVAHAKVFAFVNLDRYNDALNAIDAAHKFVKDKNFLAFEKAFCLYRLNKFTESMEVLKLVKDDEARTYLEAQLDYRMGNYDECAACYQQVLEENRDDSGVLVNLLAALISADRPSEALQVAEEHGGSENYEIAFNTACALISQQKSEAAEKELQTARKLCLEEHESPEELAAIDVQHAFLLQKRGELAEANKIYDGVLKTDGVDITVKAVACNNVVAIRPEGRSLFDSLKRINVASKESLDHKLTLNQSVIIASNRCLLLLQARKMDECRKALQSLKHKFPNHPKVALVTAAVLFAEKKVVKCEEVLRSYLKDNTSEEVSLALSHLYVTMNRFDQAATVMKQLSVKSKADPTVLQTLVTFLSRSKASGDVAAELRSAIDYWQADKSAVGEDNLAKVLRIAASVTNATEDYKFAADIYKLYLEKVDGTDTQMLCGLVKALSCVDIKQAQSHARRLKIPSFAHFDPEELESAAVPKFSWSRKVESDQGSDAKPKKARKKKIRYPKNFDPENPGPMPDPERWLPKSERTEYKRQNKYKKPLARGPQGSVPESDTAFRNKGPSTAQTEVAADAKPRRKGGKRR